MDCRGPVGSRGFHWGLGDHEGREAAGQRRENHKSGVLLPGVVGIIPSARAVGTAGGVGYVLSFSSAWSQSESTHLSLCCLEIPRSCR